MRTVIARSLNAWIYHRAGSKGATLAFHTLFSITTILILAIAAAGYFFGAEAAQGEILSQLEELVETNGAQALQALLAGAHDCSFSLVLPFLLHVSLVLSATLAVLERFAGGVWSSSYDVLGNR